MAQVEDIDLNDIEEKALDAALDRVNAEDESEELEEDDDGAEELEEDDDGAEELEEDEEASYDDVLSSKIAKLRAEGVPEKQAVAIAYKMLSESLLMEAELMEAGFTGMRKDKIGRRMHFVDGKRVKAPTVAPTVAPAKKKAVAKTKTPAAKTPAAKTPAAKTPAAKTPAAKTPPAKEKAKAKTPAKEKAKAKTSPDAKVRRSKEPSAKAKKAVAKIPTKQAAAPKRARNIEYKSVPSNVPPEFIKSQNTWSNKVSDAGLKAVKMYVAETENAFDYKMFNAKLRADEPLNVKEKRMFDQLNAAFKKVPVFKKPVLLYRGISLDKDDMQSLLAQMGESQKNGKTIALKGIVSSSLDEKIAERFIVQEGIGKVGGDVQFEIKAKRGIYAGPFRDDEQEVLQQSGTRYRVVGIKQQTNKTAAEMAKRPDISDYWSSHMYKTVIQLEEV